MSDQSSDETMSSGKSPDKRGIDGGAPADNLKRLKLGSSATPPSSQTPSTPEDDSESEKQRQNEAQTEKEQAREQKRLLRESRREAEKLDKQKRKEQERLEREHRKQQEKLEKEKRVHEEKLEKERKKEHERLERERKKQQERLEREKKKEEERLERERKKEEDRLERERKKEAEKHERERKREEERLRKEEEKRRIEEAKEKGQLKISNFFTINAKKTSATEKTVSSQAQCRQEDESNAYRRMFLPFFRKQNTLMPPSAQLSPEQLAKAIEKFDELLLSPVDSGSKGFFSSTRTPSAPPKLTTPDQIIGALNSSDTTENEIYQMLQNIPPIKYLHFYENSKPPYIGTWCSSAHSKVEFPVGDPFNTSLTGLDYDYDSDLDWNGEEEEGEDIDEDEDDEDDDMEEDDEEMDDFVETTDPKKKRRLVGPLIPVVQWNDGSNDSFFDDLQYERLHVDIQFPINPDFNYWGRSKAPETAETTTTIVTSSTTTTASPAKPASSVPNVLTPQKPKISEPQVVLALIEFIEKNNDFTIGTLVELSKKEFQKYTKALIRHTIQDVATYNKKTAHWEVKPQIKQDLVKSLQSV